MSDCKHKGKKLISSLLDIPRMGVTSLVECADCARIIGNCHWEMTKPGYFELKFSPETLQEEMDLEKEDENEKGNH